MQQRSRIVTGVLGAVVLTGLLIGLPLRSRGEGAVQTTPAPTTQTAPVTTTASTDESIQLQVGVDAVVRHTLAATGDPCLVVVSSTGAVAIACVGQATPTAMTAAQ